MDNQNAVNKEKGKWLLTKVLGSGGFGQVVLWEHKVRCFTKQVKVESLILGLNRGGLEIRLWNWL